MQLPFEASHPATLRQPLPAVPPPSAQGWRAAAAPSGPIEPQRDLRPRPRRVAIGNFDGVHLGHAAIIRGCDTVLTFDPHPLSVVAPTRAPKLLTSLWTKAQLAGRLGVREMVVVRFDEEVARQSPDAFVEEILLGRLGAVHVSVGENFHYGARGAGDVRSLRARPEFSTAVGSLLRVKGDVVSSTRIREAVEDGDVELAATLLGRPHRLTGRVSDVAAAPPFGARAAELEFLPWQVCPASGRYVCRVTAPGLPGRRVVRAVEILPLSGGTSDPADGVRARVLGPADASWGHELSVEFLRPQELGGLASR